MKTTFLPRALLNGKFIDFDDAKISIATHALHYGTAAFGGLRGWVDVDSPDQAILFRLDRHAARLANSAKYLQADFSSDYIYEKIVEFVKENKPRSPFYIRPLVYISDIGISPRVHDAEKDFLIYGLHMADYLSPKGVSLCFSSWTRQPDSSLPLRGKVSGAYITSSLAKSEAINRGFDEAVLLRTDGKVSEASAMNIFAVRNGAIITPGVEQDILEGITRDSVITIAHDLGIPVIERPLDKTELYIADEVFLCGTAARVTSVYKIESTTLPEEHPVTDKLKSALEKISIAQDPQYKKWNSIIKY